MNKFSLTLILIFLSSFSSLINAQRMRDLFISMPDSLMPLLTKTNREDCVDFLEADMKARVVNRLDGSAVMDFLSDDYLHINPSDNSETEMKLLPYNNSKIIAVIKSVNAKAKDSRISFFTTDWKELSIKDMFVMPSINDFFISDGTLNADTLEAYKNKADMYLVSLNFSQTDNGVNAVFSQPSYMSAEDSIAFSSFIIPLKYNWDEMTCKFVINRP